MNSWNLIKSKPAFIKLLNWEYWPAKMFYLPMWVYLPYLQLRSGHPCFFTATNPGIKTGGLGLESKFDTIKSIPDSLKPRTVFAPKGIAFDQVEKQLHQEGIEYPIIAKPDIGYRGLLVKKIESPEALRSYFDKYPIDIILQEFIQGLDEFGVLYYRFPWEKSGRISSLTLKDFLHVTGDGISSVRELIIAKPRASLQLERLEQTQKELLNTIPAKGNRIPLGVIGNHSKGTHFINGNKHIDEQLVKTFDQITSQIDGLYYGRYDLKCSSLEALKEGKDIVIIEINGVCSEPTHIYDSQKTSYFRALRDILKHWNIIYKISKANRKRGIDCMPTKEMIQRFWHLNKYIKKLG